MRLFTRLKSFWQLHGTAALIGLFLKKIAGRIEEQKTQSEQKQVVRDSALLVPVLLQENNPQLRRFSVLPTAGARTIHLITDSLGPNSFYGGVATALALGVVLRDALNAQALVIHTRTEKPLLDEFGEFVKQSGLRTGEVRANFMGQDKNAVLLMGPDDLVLTTSWWTTYAALSSLPINKLIYLIQEDESMFYPAGDMSLLAKQTLETKDLTLVVNSGLLNSHFTQQNIASLASRSIYFEPAMPRRARAKFPNKSFSGLKQLFFYARPGNPRNLFELGLNALELAFNKGILNPNEWEVLAVGHQLRAFTLSSGARVTLVTKLKKTDYEALLESCQLALSLMYTPHPSYVPLDAARLGCPVVTNQFGVKTSLAMYSDLIHCVNPDAQSIANALGHAAAEPATNQSLSSEIGLGICKANWQAAFEPVVAFIESSRG